jgi:hypothetical protein
MPPHSSLEPFKLIIRSFFARPALRIAQLLPGRSASASKRTSASRILLALLTVSAALSVTSCTHNLYQFPEYTFAGRPIPPSSLGERVLVGVSSNGTSGALVILDGLRDIRNNLQNTVTGYSISGYSGGYPSLILNFPEQLRGYVYSAASPFPVGTVNYSTEASTGSAGNFGGATNSIAIAPDFLRLYGAVEGNGQLVVIDQQLGGTYALNLPNVYKVAVNTGDTVALAMVRNSNTLYRVIKLNTTETTVAPPGAVDCEPNILPVYCVVPVPGTFDRPYGAYFSLDGSNVYVENCGAECGGGSNGGAGISVIPQAPLALNLVPTATPYPAVVTKTVSVPGGVTDLLSDSTYLYASGQQLQSNGLFAGFLTVIPLSTMTPAAPISISDGTHSRMLFADDNTLWVGAQYCANGQRQYLASTGNTSQSANYNCLTRVALNGTTAPTASIVPAVNQNVPSVTVPYPNTNQNLFYYGSLTGICWVQTFHKVYTAYGGQVHAFNTVDGSEINNVNITIQGTALDVAYMDALTNDAD